MTASLQGRNTNVHPRDSAAAALGPKHNKLIESDEILYTPIMLCKSLLTSAEAVSKPKMLREPTFSQGK